MLETQWPLLLRNAQGLTEASDPVVRARLLADRVGLLARHGFASHAAALLPEAREAVLELDDGEAFVRLAIAESITGFATTSGIEASDLFSTAIEAAREHRLPELEAEASIWAASVRWSRGPDNAGVVEWIRFALQHAGPACESTLPNALYRAGNCFVSVGLHDDAQRWYRHAMRAARRAEDQQLCEAIATYPLLIELNNARAAYVQGTLARADAQDLEERLGAAAGQQSYAGGKRAQIQIHRAEALRLMGRYAEAIKVLDLYLPQSQVRGLGSIELLIGRSDRAVCQLRLHDKRGASQERQHIRHALAAGRMSLYSRAALLTNLVEMEQLLGHPEAAGELSIGAADMWSRRERQLDALRGELEATDLRSLLPIEPLAQRTRW